MPLVNKTFSDIITFSRASSATMFDSSGTLVYAPMNLMLWSEDLTQATWSLADGTVTANSWTPPTGSATGDTYTIGTSAASPAAFLTVVSSTTYTLSFYYNKTLTTAAFFRLRFGTASGSVSAWVDAANNTFGALNAQLSGGVVTDVGSNIYRVSLQIAYGATDGGSRSVAIAGVTANSGTTADTGNDLAIWGAQLNIANMQGGVTADLSTYYPTTSAAYQGPRLDYDPATLAARGLLIEEQRTNLATYSAALDDALGWAPQSGLTVTANAITSPDGTLSAERLASNGISQGFLDKTFAITSGTTYTFSCFFKKHNTSTVQILIYGSQFNSGGANVSGTFNLDTGIATGVNGTASMTAVGNGWYRCVLTKDATTTGSFPQQTVRMASATGDVYAWGYQLEAGAFPTSYIPTTTTSLTRSADVASVNTLSPWFNASASTLYAEVLLANLPAVSTFPVYAGFNDGATVNDTIHLSSNSFANHRVSVRSGGDSLWDVNAGGSIVAGTPSKWALAVASGSQAACANGGSVATNSTAGLPAGLSRLGIGSQLPATGLATAWIRRVTYYPRALSAAELQAITA